MPGRAAGRLGVRVGAREEGRLVAREIGRYAPRGYCAKAYRALPTTWHTAPHW